MHDTWYMPFGKHKGQPFSEIPPDYFRWLLRQDWIEQWPDLREDIEDYLSSKRNQRQQAPPWSGPPQLQLTTANERADFKMILNLGYRALAKKYHPDTGGSTETMKRLNLLAEKLRASGLL